MRKLEIGQSAAAVLVALLIFVPPSAAQVARAKQPAKQMVKRSAVAEEAASPCPAGECERPATMNLALNNATNVAQYYKDLGEKVAIEIVPFGPGLHMLRDDTSPVKARIKTIKEGNPAIISGRQYPGKHAQGREQGNSPDSRGDGRESPASCASWNCRNRAGPM